MTKFAVSVSGQLTRKQLNAIGRNLRQTHLGVSRQEFAALLDKHLKRGQKAECPESRWKPWTNSEFAGVVGVSPNSVANWRNTMSPTPPGDIRPLLGVLFGEKPEYALRRRAQRSVGTRKNLLPVEAYGSDGFDMWEPTGRRHHTPLAEVILHQPTPLNQLETYSLHARSSWMKLSNPMAPTPS